VFVQETLRRDPGDRQWWVRWPAAVLTGRFGRHEGRCDPGQRLANLLLVGGLLVLVGTGLGLTALHGGPVFAWLSRIHRWTTYVVTTLIAGDVLIALGVLPGYRGVWRSMHPPGRGAGGDGTTCLARLDRAGAGPGQPEPAGPAGGRPFRGGVAASRGPPRAGPPGRVRSRPARRRRTPGRAATPCERRPCRGRRVQGPEPEGASGAPATGAGPGAPPGGPTSSEPPAPAGPPAAPVGTSSLRP
jgi:hypothetical protein